MTSASEYRRQLSGQGLDRLKFSASNLVEAKAVLVKIREAQGMLRQMKRSINVDMKQIRSEYAQRAVSAASGTSAVLALLGKRGAAGRVRADEKRRLGHERDRELAPYNDLKLSIDDMLAQLGGAKLRTESFIEELKAEELAERQKAAKPKASSEARARKAHCPECGDAVEAGDRYCRKCGSLLS